jgi:LDH2 family malate/lactate/ureidoglycolate dehydrogenase
VLARAENPTPVGWAVDANGAPLTASREISISLETGKAMLLSTGGYKGYDLSTMVEILCTSYKECDLTEAKTA